MAPAKLVVKSSTGALEPFEVDGVEWIDGSVQADLPFQRIATLFAVTSFIVSQTNFHVVPFLNKEHHPSRNSLYWRLFQTMEWDMRSRALKLSRLGLFPRLYGQDISKVFKQKYHGNLTIVPRFTTSQTFGLKALANPTVEDMEGYLKYGQIATWPYLNAIRDMIRLEKALDDCLARLEARMRVMDPDIDLANHDDVESIASSSLLASNSASRVRIIGRPSFVNHSVRDRESDRLRQENQHLQLEIERLRKLLQEKEEQSEARQEKNERDDPASWRASLSDVSEGAIWNLVRKSSTEQID
jgi:TAG lipase/steryl ester hydrolase/phospholipase A2/LPA acyltransferase